MPKYLQVNRQAFLSSSLSTPHSVVNVLEPQLVSPVGNDLKVVLSQRNLRKAFNQSLCITGRLVELGGGASKTKSHVTATDLPHPLVFQTGYP